MYANERALEWVGYTPEELNGQDLRILTPPGLREAVSNDFEEVLAGDERARVGLSERSVRRFHSLKAHVPTNQCPINGRCIDFAKMGRFGFLSSWPSAVSRRSRPGPDYGWSRGSCGIRSDREG